MHCAPALSTCCAPVTSAIAAAAECVCVCLCVCLCVGRPLIVEGPSPLLFCFLSPDCGSVAALSALKRDCSRGPLCCTAERDFSAEDKRRGERSAFFFPRAVPFSSLSLSSVAVSTSGFCRDKAALCIRGLSRVAAWMRSAAVGEEPHGDERKSGSSFSLSFLRRRDHWRVREGEKRVGV